MLAFQLKFFVVLLTCRAFQQCILKVNNRNTRTICKICLKLKWRHQNDVILVSLWLNLNIIRFFSSVSVVEFEQVNVWLHVNQIGKNSLYVSYTGFIEDLSNSYRLYFHLQSYIHCVLSKRKTSHLTKMWLHAS